LAWVLVGVVAGAQGWISEDGICFVEFFEPGGGVWGIVLIWVPFFDEFMKCGFDFVVAGIAAYCEDLVKIDSEGFGCTLLGIGIR